MPPICPAVAVSASIGEAQAEDTILIAHRRIGEELRNVPKAAGRPAKILSEQGENKSGRARHIRGNSTRDIKWLCVLPEITGKV
jgi:hypothetical protein